MDNKTQAVATALATRACTFKDWGSALIKDGWDHGPITPEMWKQLDSEGKKIEPDTVLTVDLPWLPLHEINTCHALIAVSMVEALVEDAGSASTETKDGLRALTCGLYTLIGQPSPIGWSKPYTTALRTVIPLWHKVFVPAVLTVKAAFVVVVGVRSRDEKLALCLYDGPFQLPWGWVDYRKVTYENNLSLSPRVLAAHPWATRARMV